MNFFKSHPFHSIEGYTILTLATVGCICHKTIIDRATTNQSNFTAALTLEFFRSLFGAFFNSIAEKRRLDAEQQNLMLKLALESSEKYTQEATEAQNQCKWIIAAESYMEAAKTLTLAEVKSSLLELKKNSMYIHGARCFILGEKLQLALAALNQLGLSEHNAHPSQFFALRGIVHLGLGAAKAAAEDFRSSLRKDPQQKNIMLLYLYAQGEHKAIISEYKIASTDNIEQSNRIDFDDHSFGPALIAFARSLFAENEKAKAIAIYEAILGQMNGFKPGFFRRAEVIQTLLDMYQQSEPTPIQPISISIDKGRVLSKPEGPSYQLDSDKIARKIQEGTQQLQMLTSRAALIEAPTNAMKI